MVLCYLKCNHWDYTHYLPRCKAEGGGIQGTFAQKVVPPLNFILPLPFTVLNSQLSPILCVWLMTCQFRCRRWFIIAWVKQHVFPPLSPQMLSEQGLQLCSHLHTFSTQVGKESGLKRKLFLVSSLFFAPPSCRNTPNLIISFFLSLSLSLFLILGYN